MKKLVFIFITIVAAVSIPVGTLAATKQMTVLDYLRRISKTLDLLLSRQSLGAVVVPSGDIAQSERKSNFYVVNTSTVQGVIVPQTANTGSVGTTTLPFGFGNFNNLVVGVGGCTGCGGGGGASLSATNTWTGLNTFTNTTTLATTTLTGALIVPSTATINNLVIAGEAIKDPTQGVGSYLTFYSGVTQLGSPNGGAIYFNIGDTAKWQLSAGGNFIASSDNNFSIGNIGGNRPSNIYAANVISALVGLGVGTSTPAGAIAATTAGTTTFFLDSSVSTKGTCIISKDYNAATYTYCVTSAGALTCSANKCN
ncbi:MAG: hypothetical protein NVSMB66_6230 [Candidatus Doudnabacteria bacterium]